LSDKAGPDPLNPRSDSDSHETLLDETEWSRRYVDPSGLIRYESKFLSDRIEVDYETIIARWNTLTKREKYDFVRSFRGKRQLEPQDEKLLEFLMDTPDEVVWRLIALMITRHSNRQLVTRFILRRIKESSERRSNYYQAAEIICDAIFIPVLEEQFRAASRKLGSAPVPSPESDSTYLEFICLCKTLWKLTSEDEYRESIQRLLRHPSDSVRYSAQRQLQAM
jgi:hypothetical protein